MKPSEARSLTIMCIYLYKYNSDDHVHFITGNSFRETKNVEIF